MQGTKIQCVLLTNATILVTLDLLHSSTSSTSSTSAVFRCVLIADLTRNADVAIVRKLKKYLTPPRYLRLTGALARKHFWRAAVEVQLVGTQLHLVCRTNGCVATVVGFAG